MRKFHIATLAVIVSALFIASCANTVRGAGKDVKATAKAFEESVE